MSSLLLLTSQCVVTLVLQEDERIERIELQRQQLSQQLKTMLQANNSNNNNPTARAAMQQRQMPPVILD